MIRNPKYFLCTVCTFLFLFALAILTWRLIPNISERYYWGLPAWVILFAVVQSLSIGLIFGLSRLKWDDSND